MTQTLEHPPANSEQDAGQPMPPSGRVAWAELIGSTGIAAAAGGAAIGAAVGPEGAILGGIVGAAIGLLLGRRRGH